MTRTVRGTPPVVWNQERDAALVALVPQHVCLRDVAVELTQRFGATFTLFSVRHRCSRLGIDSRALLGSARRRSDTIPAPAPEMAQRGPVAAFGGPSVAKAVPRPPPSRPSVPEGDEDPEIPIEVAEPIRERTARDDVREHALREKVRELEHAKRRLLEELHDKEAQLGIVETLRGAPKLAPIMAKTARGEGMRRIGTPVMLLSDWHVEEPVEPAKVNGLNEYNLDIANACIERIPEAYEWFTRDPRWDMREGIVWLGGDLYSGHIHDELAEHNFLSPVEATLWLQERIEKMLRRILAMTNLERLIVVCNDGNHGRLTHRIRIATRTANSLEWLMYQTLAARLRDEPRIQFIIAEGEYVYLDVYDKTLCFFHGDSVQYQGGIGGLLIPLRRGLNELRKYRKVDVFNLGHFHERLDLADIAVNGSMIGITPYGMNKKMKPEPRQQSWYLVDSTRGKCVSAPVWM